MDFVLYWCIYNQTAMGHGGCFYSKDIEYSSHSRGDYTTPHKGRGICNDIALPAFAGLIPI